MTSLKGNLNAVDLGNIFQMLSMNQREGTLYIYDGTSKKAIYFGPDGVSTLTRGKARQDSLGRILLRHERLTREQLDEALARQAEAGGDLMLGQVLVEQGMVSRSEVEEALQLQIEEEVYNLFIWKDAQFEFVEGPPEGEFEASEGITKLTFNPNNLIMEATRRIDEWEWIQTVVIGTGGIFRYSGANVELEDPVFQEDWAGNVLGAIDGKRSVADIIECSYVNQFEVCKILSLLIEGDAVEPVPVPALHNLADEALAAGDTAQAVKVLNRVIEMEGDTPELHKQIAEAYESERNLAKAVFHYRVYAEVQADEGNVGEAFRTYHRIVEILPTDLAAADRMVEIFCVNPDGLEEYAHEIIEQGKLLAECYTEFGRTSRAVQVLHRVVAMGSDDRDLRSRLIQVYLASGMTGEAIAEYEALAESAASLGDLDEAARIYRKVLAIDKTRDDIHHRVNQLLSKRMRRKRRVRLAIVGILVSIGLAVGAWYGYQYLLEQRATQKDLRAQAAIEADKVRTEYAAVIEQIRTQQYELTKALSDASRLANIFRSQKPARAATRTRTQEAIDRYLQLVEAFPRTPAAEGASAEANALAGMLRGLEDREKDARERLAKSAKDYYRQAMSLHEGDGHIRLVHEKLQRALTIGQGIDEWTASDDGKRCASFGKNCSDNIKQYEDTTQAMKDLLADGRPAEAFAAGVDFLCSFPSPHLAAELALPLWIGSQPLGARVHMDGKDTGVDSPGVVWVQVRKGANLELRADGFAPASYRVPLLAATDPAEIRKEVRQTHVIKLQKQLRWESKPLSGALEAPFTPSEMGLFVPTRGASLEVLDTETGTRLRRLATKTPDGVRVRAVEHKGVLAVAAMNKAVLFFRARSGDYIGDHKVAGAVRADPALAGDLLLVPDAEGHVTAIQVTAAEQKEIWRYPARGETGRDQGFLGPVSVVDKRVYAVTGGGTVCVINLESGVLEREFNILHNGTRASPTAAPVVAGDDLLVCLRGGVLARVRVSDGKQQWARTVSNQLVGPPVVHDGLAIAVAEAGFVMALRVSDGTVARKEPLPGRVHARATLVDGTLYVGDSTGTLTALAVADGTLAMSWRYRISSKGREPVSITTPPVVTATLILFGASDHVVHAVER